MLMVQEEFAQRLLARCATGSGQKVNPLQKNMGVRFILGVTSMSILSRDPNLSRKPPKTLWKWRSLLEKNDG